MTSLNKYGYGIPGVQGLAVNSTSLYSINITDNQVNSTNSNGYSFPSGTVSALVADEAGVYWLEKTSSAGKWSVVRHDAANISGAGTTLASGYASAWALAVYRGYVYWGIDDGSIVSVSATGGSVTTITGHASPSYLAIDGSGLYWTSASNKAVMHAPLNGVGNGSPDQLAHDQNGPSDITLDATTIYWANSDGGQVMKLAK